MFGEDPNGWKFKGTTFLVFNFESVVFVQDSLESFLCLPALAYFSPLILFIFIYTSSITLEPKLDSRVYFPFHQVGENSVHKKTFI